MFHELKQNSGWQKRDKWKASHCPLLLHGVRWEKEAEGRRGDGGSGPALSGVRFRWRRKQQMPLRPFNKTKTHAEASSIVLCGELIYIKYNWGQKRGRTKWDLCLPSLLRNGSNMSHLFAEDVLLMWTSCRVFRQKENAPGMWSNHCLYL